MCHGTFAEYGVKGGRTLAVSSSNVEDDDVDGRRSSEEEDIREPDIEEAEWSGDDGDGAFSDLDVERSFKSMFSLSLCCSCESLLTMMCTLVSVRATTRKPMEREGGAGDEIGRAHV